MSRFIATTARRLEATTSRGATPALINGEDLPPVIQRYIQRHINQSSSSPTSTIPNPFIAHQRQRNTSSSLQTTNTEGSTRRTTRIPPVIPRRRQKQLADFFSREVLPPSARSEVPTPQIKWSDPWTGERTITWSGGLSSEGRAGLYEGRKRMFKGHKHEVKKIQRDKDTAERLKGMEKRIEDWKKGKIEAKTSAKPALPF